MHDSLGPHGTERLPIPLGALLCLRSPALWQFALFGLPRFTVFLVRTLILAVVLYLLFILIGPFYVILLALGAPSAG